MDRPLSRQTSNEVGCVAVLGANRLTPLGDEEVIHKIAEYEEWYRASATRWERALFLLRTLSVLGGFLAALLTALTVGHSGSSDALKYWVIGLSSLGSLTATLLAQYGVAEIERLRCDGLISCTALRLRATNKLPALKGARRVAYIGTIFEELIKLDKEQNAGFHYLFSGRGKRS
jgi:hypothetical protein